VFNQWFFLRPRPHPHLRPGPLSPLIEQRFPLAPVTDMGYGTPSFPSNPTKPAAGGRAFSRARFPLIQRRWNFLPHSFRRFVDLFFERDHVSPSATDVSAPLLFPFPLFSFFLRDPGPVEVPLFLVTSRLTRLLFFSLRYPAQFECSFPFIFSSPVFCFCGRGRTFGSPPPMPSTTHGRGDRLRFPPPVACTECALFLFCFFPFLPWDRDRRRTSPPFHRGA